MISNLLVLAVATSLCIITFGVLGDRVPDRVVNAVVYAAAGFLAGILILEILAL